MSLSPVAILHNTAGTEVGTAGNALRVDPTGTTTQPVSGTVGVSGSVAVTGTFWQATQPVSAASLPLPTGAATETTLSGILTTSAFQARIPVNGQALMAASLPVTIASNQSALAVTGTFWQTTQPVSIAATVAVSGPLTDTELRATAVPVSVASLPLPSGAATESTLAGVLTTTAFQARINTLGQKTMSASTPVVISSDQSVIPVSDNSGSLTVDSPQLPAALVSGRLDVNVGASTTVAVSQSGTWTVQQGTAPWTQRLQDGSGSNLLAVDASGRAAIQNQPNMDVALSTRATEATLASIKDTDGIKKITDSLPAGTNRLGKVRLVDDNDVRLDLARNTVIPAGSRGLLTVGQDEDGAAQALDVREDSVDLVRRLQIEGRVSVIAPQPPPSTVPVSISADTPLSISNDKTKAYVITNAKTFYLQQITAGSEGDTSEKGSCVEVSYYDGTTDHLIERIYLNGFTTSVSFNNVYKSRDGTTITGNGTTKTIRVKRRRLSGSSQEVDAVVRGYEQ